MNQPEQDVVIAQRYTYATVASDLSHLEAAATAHLETARS